MGRAQTIERLAREHDWRVGAELGVFDGRTTRHLLQHVPRLRMIAVDEWRPIPGPAQDRFAGKAAYSPEVMRRAELLALEVQRQYPDRMRIIRNDTYYAASFVKDEELDFVFIDADHSTDAVMLDVNTWARKVKPRGAILGHDYDWPSVRRALERLGLRHTVLPGNVWLCCDDSRVCSQEHFGGLNLL